MIYLSGHVSRKLPPEFGVIVTPIGNHRVEEGRVWAADNGCFTQPHRHDDDRYIEWLGKRVEHVKLCRFATAPDVVGDSVATIRRSLPMLGRIRAAGFPAALVGQDGMEASDIPWDDIDAFFIGGTTNWKLGSVAASLAAEARRRGKWVHMGRVNSLRRLRLAQSMGCHSADGTFAAFGPDKNIPRMQAWMDALRREPMLPMGGVA